MAKKICVVLGSGGSRGISHIGVLQALIENDIKPDYIIGCSMGSIVGACYACGMKPSEMKEVAESLKLSNIADFSIFPLNKLSLLKSVKVRDTLKKHVGEIRFEELEIPFKCVAFDIVNGETVTLSEGPVEPAIMASSAIPAVFKPVEMDGKILVDGGVRTRLPLKEAQDFNADIIIAVDVLGPLKPFSTPKNIVDKILRVVDANDWNWTKDCLEKYKPDVLIVPDLGDMNQFKVERITFAYEQGYKAGLEAISDIKKAMRRRKKK